MSCISVKKLSQNFILITYSTKIKIILSVTWWGVLWEFMWLYRYDEMIKLSCQYGYIRMYFGIWLIFFTTVNNYFLLSQIHSIISGSMKSCFSNSMKWWIYYNVNLKQMFITSSWVGDK